MFSHKTYRKLMMVALLGLGSAISTNAMAMASAELYNTEANFYGRFEARIRFAPGDGVVSSFFLWKEGSEVSGAYWNELDFEKIGADCRLQTNSIYGKPSANHEQKNTVSGNLCNDYHDFRFEWTPTYIAWVIDGKEIRRDTGDAASAYSQNATTGMTFHFNIWPGTQDFGGNINNTTLPVHEYISWVQYSTYNNGNFEQKWREDFQGTTLPEGWGVGDWKSPMGQSTHDPKNVNFVNGIAVLSITADNATGNPGTPPADPNAGGSGGNGGTSGSGGSGGSKSSSAGSSSGGSSSGGGSSSAGGSTSVSGSSSSGGGSSTGGSTSGGGTGGSHASTTTGSGGSTGQTGGRSGTGTTGGTSSTGGTASGGQSSSSSSNGSNGGSSASSSSSSGGAMGGSSSSSSSAQGGASASSASKSSSAGGSSSSGGSQSTSGSSGSADDSSSSGCNCRFGHSRDAAPPLVVLTLLVATLLRRTRKKGV